MRIDYTGIIKLARSGVNILREHSTTVMTVIGLSGVATTAYLAVKGDRAAQPAILEEEITSGTPEGKLEHVKRYVKHSWPHHFPTVCSAAVTVTSIVLMNRTHNRRYSALLGVYALSERAFQEYRDSVNEVVGESNGQKIRQEAAKKAAERDDELEHHLNMHGEYGLVYDCFSGRYFKSDMETIRKAENDFNEHLLRFDYGSLNELYTRIGISGIGAGEDIGWTSDKLISIGYNSILTDRGIPVMSIDFYDNPPRYNYYNNH